MPPKANQLAGLHECSDDCIDPRHFDFAWQETEHSDRGKPAPKEEGWVTPSEALPLGCTTTPMVDYSPDFEHLPGELDSLGTELEQPVEHDYQAVQAGMTSAFLFGPCWNDLGEGHTQTCEAEDFLGNHRGHAGSSPIFENIDANQAVRPLLDPLLTSNSPSTAAVDAARTDWPALSSNNVSKMPAGGHKVPFWNSETYHAPDRERLHKHNTTRNEMLAQSALLGLDNAATTVYDVADDAPMYDGVTDLLISDPEVHAKTHADVADLKDCRCQHPDCTRPKHIFFDASAVRRHARAHKSEEERPHKCRHCEKRFEYLKDVRRHENTHGDRRFMCFYCATTFSRQDNLERHSRRRHPRKGVQIEKVESSVAGASTASTTDPRPCPEVENGSEYEAAPTSDASASAPGLPLRRVTPPDSDVPYSDNLISSSYRSSLPSDI